MPDHPHQKDLRKGRFSQPYGLYFVTKCLVKGGDLSDDQRTDIIMALYHLRDKRELYLHAFVIMPDHWHALFSLTEQKELNLVIRDICRHASFAWRQGSVSFAWQDGFHDHKVREGQTIDDILLYIENNPVRKALITNREQWPWSSAHRKYTEQLDRDFLYYGRWRE